MRRIAPMSVALFAACLAALAQSSAPNAPLSPPGPSRSGSSPDTSATPTVGDPVGLADGSVYETAVDLRIPCPDIDLVFRRSYGSWSLRTGPLGYGWTHGYDWTVEEDGTNSVVVWSSGEDGPSDASHTFQPVAPGGVSWNADGYGLRRGADGRYSVVTPRAETYAFDAQGRLASVSSWNGTTVSLSRDADGRLVAVGHPCGMALYFEYGPYGLGQRIQRVETSSTGVWLEFSYCDAGDVGIPSLESVVRHDGGRASTNSYSYTALPPGRRPVPPRGNLLPTNIMGGGGTRGAPAQPQLRSGPSSARPVLERKTGADGISTAYSYVRPDDSPKAWCTRSVMDGGLFAVDLDINWGVRSTTFRRPFAGGVSETRVGFDDWRREFSRTTGAETRTKTYSDEGDVVGETLSDSASGAWTTTARTFDSRHRVTSQGTAHCAEPQDFFSVEWDDRRNIPRRTVSPEGRVSEWTEAGHDVTVHGAGMNDPRAVARILCTADDRPYAIVSPGGGRTDISYDECGYMSQVSAECLPPVSFTRDALGRVASATLPGPSGGRTTSFVRNWRGRPLSVSYPDGGGETFEYSGNGTKVVRHVDALGHEDLYQWVLGLPIHAARVVDGATNALFSIRHDEQLNVVAITDPLGRDAEMYVLDVNERIVAVTNVEGQAMSRSYAVGDMVSSETRFDGTQVAYGYDAAGRLATVSYPGETLAFSYDRDGLLVSASNAVGVVSNAYDAATGWLASSCGADGTEVAFAYSPGGDVTGVVSVAGTTSYMLDKADRRVRIDSPAGVFDIAYCAWNGRVSAITNVNGLVATYAYDVMDRVTNIAWRTAGGDALGSFAYSYDATGRIVERDFSLGDPSQPNNPSQPTQMSQSSHKTYSYDSLDRLAMDGDVSYAYDAAGNRTAKIDPAQGTTLYTLGLGDRLAAYGRAASPLAAEGSYAYDTAGNVTNIVRENGSTLDLTWNSQYQLVSVSTNGAFAESYSYDALGRRVSTTTLDGTTRHVYDDNWQCIADIDENNNVVCSYVWGEGIDNILAVKIDGVSYYPLTDIQGTVWGYVDSSNDIVARFDYDAWGNILTSTSTIPALARNRYRFQGREWSVATGLTNFRMRWYDAETGRWLSKDPIGLGGGLNLYVFCENDAMNRTDPKGTIAPFVVGAVIGGVVGGVVGGIGNMYKGGSFWGGAISGAIGGAVTGATFGLLSPVVTGFGIGAAAGAVAGALGGAASGVADELVKPCNEDFNWGNVGMSAIGGAIGGAIAGGLIGLGGEALHDAANWGSETLINGDVSLWGSIFSSGARE